MRQVFTNIIFITLLSLPGFAQQKYWIVFKDKDLDTKAEISDLCKYNRRFLGLEESQSSDLPVSKRYTSALQDIAIQPLQKSKWLNAVSAHLTATQLSNVNALGFVKNIIPIDSKVILAKLDKKPSDDLRVDFVMKQVGIESFLQSGLNGKDVTIGVIDAGFYGVSESPTLRHLIEKKRILGVRDYVNPRKTDHFNERETSSDFHGGEVLNSITGMNEYDNIQFGLATNAQFYLARTDSGNKEFRGEEDNWVAAMEWMDSLGVRLINTSLGYAKGFSNPKENYKPEQMNGNTSVIARAAKMAAEEKGIIVVVSAGNEGDDRDWRIISTPADVEGVIAVGATNEVGMRMGYSSIGPDFLDYLKPNVSCYSLYGTSLAAPVITGFVACMLQANPKLTNKEVRSYIQKSSSLYPFGNNFVGYGVPSAEKVLDLITHPDRVPLESKQASRTLVVPEGDRQVEIGVQEGETVVIFHKKSPFHVISQEAQKAKYNLISLKRSSQVKETTVITKEEIIEVIWR